MAYFNNAATTYPKPSCVYDFMNYFYRNYGGSFGRGQYDKSKSIDALVYDTRNRLKSLLHCPAKEVVFEPTATISLNIIIQGLITNGIHNVYISPFEHNTVTRILHAYEKKNLIKVHVLSVSEECKYDLQRIQFQFDEVQPELMIVSHASNVTGLIAPVLDIFELAKRYGAITVVDMAQTAGLVDLNVGLDIVDFAVFDGHKTLMGPTGISGFIMKPGFDLPPVLFGGTGFESANQDMPDSLPQRYEMGTMNSIGVAGLNAALKWIQDQTVETIRGKDCDNRLRLIKLLNEYDFLDIIGVYDGCEYVGIVSCLMEGISSDSAGNIFNERNIAIRTGLQCAPLAHQFLGTYPAGTIRFSVSCLTSEADFNELKDALDEVASAM